MEEIRRNDNTLLLKKYFPGQSCGNEECEKQGIELCKILEKNIFLQKEDISRIAAKQMIIPDYCPVLKNPSNGNSCRFHSFLSPSLVVYADHNGRKVIGKKYITDADSSKEGACQKCLEYANRIFKLPEEAHLMPKLPLHPNCKCRYEDVYEIPSEHEMKKAMIKLAFDLTKQYVNAKIHTVTEEYISKIYDWASNVYNTARLGAVSLVRIVTTSILINSEGRGTAVYNIKQPKPDFTLEIYGKTIDGYDELINNLRQRRKQAKKLILINHGRGAPGTMSIGKGPDLDNLSDKQIFELKKYLAPNCIIYMRACKDAGDEEAVKRYKRFTKRIGRLVVAYQGFVSPFGSIPPYAKDADERTGRIFLVLFPKHIPVIFSPY